MDQLSSKIELQNFADAINEALLKVSDKDWNYSRIQLLCRDLASSEGPYALWVDRLDLETNEGRAALRACAKEVSWGDRHSSELGILEIISLRLNKALLEGTDGDHWGQFRPIIRVISRQDIEAKGIGTAFWYEVTEVTGVDFDTR